MNPNWLDWTQRLQAIAQTGLTFARDPYDVERYEQIRQIARLFAHCRHPEWPADFD